MEKRFLRSELEAVDILNHLPSFCIHLLLTLRLYPALTCTVALHGRRAIVHVSAVPSSVFVSISQLFASPVLLQVAPLALRPAEP